MLIWLDGPLGLALLVLVLLLVLGWYLSYLAARLDRLHHRVESSRAALEARLARRAAAAVEAGRLLDPVDGALIVEVAGRALSSSPAPRSDVRGLLIAEPPVDESCENELTRALHQAFADPLAVAELRRDPATGRVIDELASAGERVQLARRFHNDAVAHAQRMRRKRVVRWARLAGRAELPVMVEIDDSLPLGLAPPLM
jgi:hypothetical protein